MVNFRLWRAQQQMPAVRLGGSSAVPLSIEHGPGKAKADDQTGHMGEGRRKRRGNRRWVQLETAQPYRR